MQSKEVHMIGRIHADIFNLPRLLVKIQVGLTKAKDIFYLMITEHTSTASFNFL
jgi:hypothetical protein